MTQFFGNYLSRRHINLKFLNFKITSYLLSYLRWDNLLMRNTNNRLISNNLLSNIENSQTATNQLNDEMRKTANELLDSMQDSRFSETEVKFLTEYRLYFSFKTRLECTLFFSFYNLYEIYQSMGLIQMKKATRSMI